MSELTLAGSDRPSTVSVERWLVVAERVEEADGVVSLTLGAEDGLPLPPWLPGAHCEVEVNGGLRRQYSLCGRPSDPAWRIAVLREPASRGGSRWLHDEAEAGTRLRVTELRNHFPYEGPGPVVFVAGGIGITPLLPMLAVAEESGVPWKLHYAGRSRESMAFLGELAAYTGRVELYPSDTGHHLDVDQVARELPAGARVYACGPARLLDALEQGLAATSAALRTERFRGVEVDSSGDRPFLVRCARSETDVEVKADQSILAALAEAGVAQTSQCEEGVCGSCETAVLDGVPEHRDLLLTDEERAENTTMMICVSRARSPRLVLDV